MHPDLLFVRAGLSRLICSVEPEGGDDGGGGGGDGSGGTGDDGAGKKPQYMTPDQVNKAMKDHTSRAAKAGEVRLKAIETGLAQLTEALTKLGAGEGAGSGSAGGTGGDKAAPPAEWQKQLADLSSKLEKANARADEEKKAREEASAAARAKEERSALKDALIERGVTPAQAPVLAAHLHGEAKAILRTEDDEILFKLGDDEFALGDGVEKFLATDAGKAWLPPRDAKGSGATAGGNNHRRQKGPVTLEDVGAQLESTWNRR